MQKILSLPRRAFLKALRIFGQSKSAQMAFLGVGEEWFQLISLANRRLLLDACGERSKLGPLDSYSWKIAPSLLGAEWSHRTSQNPEDLVALRSVFDRMIDFQGGWVVPAEWGEHAMKGYSLLYLAHLTGDTRYRSASDQLVEALIVVHPRTADGSLPYRPDRQEILVDTLAMVCPFLARYANQCQYPDALELGVNQLVQFVRSNVDDETHLPYHGYYADGPKRLGMHAWGRGTGWYMLGLIDTLLEMPYDHPSYAELAGAYVRAAESLRRFQQTDGAWAWAILHEHDVLDSSTTSLVGYSLMRGIQLGILDQSFRTVVDDAARSLVSVTCSSGVLVGALGECRGLGKYPQVYGPTPWLQGSATAFAALYLAKGQTERGSAI